MEHRRFHRVKFSARGDLQHQGMNYPVRLENISLRGALISSNECIMVPAGDVCTLTIELADGAVLQLTAEVVHSFFSMVGVEFVAFAQDTELRLFRLLETITSNPDQLEQEWQAVLAASPAGSRVRR
jgi:hypothetical protein